MPIGASQMIASRVLVSHQPQRLCIQELSGGALAEVGEMRAHNLQRQGHINRTVGQARQSEN
jgi:hypothetical protein